MNRQVSFDDEPLILVNANGEAVGSMPKLECHLGQGIRHRAFSVFVFNSADEVLLQQRGADKMLWPSFWSNSCCSHPRLGEDEVSAAQRRIREELGMSVSQLTKHFQFEYQASYEDKGSEWELCSVFTARSDEPVLANPTEIDACKWVPITELATLLTAESDSFTPWIKLEWQRLQPLLQSA